MYLLLHVLKLSDLLIHAFEFLPLRHSQIFSDILKPSQTLSDILRHSETLSDILRHSQTLSDTLRHSQTLPVTLRHFQPLSDTDGKRWEVLDVSFNGDSSSIDSISLFASFSLWKELGTGQRMDESGARGRKELGTGQRINSLASTPT